MAKKTSVEKRDEIAYLWDLKSLSKEDQVALKKSLRAQLIDREQIWLDSDNSADQEYGNKSPIAGSSLGVKFSQETIRRIKEARNRQESRKASSDALKGKPKSTEHRLHLSLAKKRTSRMCKKFWRYVW